MAYFLVFFALLLWILSLLGYGSILFFSKNLNAAFSSLGSIKITILGIFGFFILSFLGNVFNFFIPLNIIFISIIFLIGLILFVINFKKIFLNIKTYHFVSFFFLIAFLALAPFNWGKLHDIGLYYIQSIKWINESQLPFGLANLHGRLGFNSSWLMDAALIEPFLLLKNSPIFLINSILSFFLGSSVFLNIFEKIYSRLEFSDIFLFSISIPWLLKSNFFIASPSADLPAMLIVLFIFYLLIKSYEEFEKYRFFHFVAITLACFVFTVKISTFPILIGSIVSFIYSEIIKTKKHVIYWGNNNRDYYPLLLIPSVLSTFIWIIRNIIMSGCIVYPISLGHFSNLKWSVSDVALKNENDWIKSWARDSTKTPEEVLGNWNWIKTWFADFIKSEKLLFIIVILGLMLIFFYIFKSFREKPNSLKINLIIIPISISLLGILFWFFNAPDKRFGYGFLYAFGLSVFSYGIFINDFKIKTINYKKAFAILAIVILFIYGGDLILNKSSIDIAFKDELIEMPNVEHEVKLTDSGVKINVPIGTDQSWNYALPSTPYFNKNLKVIFKNNNYRMFYFDD